MNRSLLPTLVLASLLSGCAGPPRLLNFGFDPGGRGLNSPAAELQPQLAGSYLTFVSDRRGSQDIYMYDIASQRFLDIPGLNRLDAIASHPSVSADGRWIVFAATRQGLSGIYLYDRSTRQLRNLTEGLRAEVRNPTISANGNLIAFESGSNGQWDVLVYNRAGQPIGVDTNPR